jgi:polysaccharide deacetylase 2 family uncharacterized protein YibQ
MAVARKKRTTRTGIKKESAGKTRITSAKKRAPKGERIRFTLICVFSLLILALSTVFCYLLIRERVSPVSPLSREKYIEREIKRIHERIGRDLMTLGITEDLIEKQKEETLTANRVSFLSIDETYRIPEDRAADDIKQQMEEGLGSWGENVVIEHHDLPGGGITVSVVAFGLSIRKMTFMPQLAPLPRIAIIMDDMGTNTLYWDDIFSMSYPITLSVFPHQPYSEKIARRAHGEGYDVMLHLPMEPIDYKNHNPGPGVLLVSMTDDELKEVFLSDLSEVPYVTGINNHMGSLLTQDREAMEVILEEIKKRGLFFVDSRTTPDTIAYKTAKEMDVLAFERSVFLDNDRDVTAITKRIEELVRTAKKRGSAIGICHPYPETIQALKAAEKRLSAGEVEAVSMSDLLP